MAHRSLRERQVLALKKALNLNQDIKEETEQDNALALQGAANSTTTTEGGDILWKILVFDHMGSDVLSTVLHVSDLRAMGVTMHMNISASRHPIPDVPAVYLVEPTKANLSQITQDLEKNLYGQAYVNFLHSINRPLLEDWATETATAGTSEAIASVFDQHLNFICPKDDLFSLGMEKDHAYYALNSPKTSDEELDHVVDKIVTGLFSVIVTMGVIPIIRAPKDGAAQMIATKLDRKLRDHVLNSKGSSDPLFSSSGRPGSSASAVSSRPVLVLLDRNIDLTPMLSHSWTYNSLVNDVLSMKLNRVTIETAVDESNPAQGTTKKAFDLAGNDFFWRRNANAPFPNVAEDIDAELTKYKEDSAAITAKTGASSLEDLQNDTSASAQHLKAAITLLPELQERKKFLDIHMNILAALLTGIKNRQVDNYYQLEENVSKQTKAQVLDLIKDHEGKGNQPLDKLRFFIIWILTTEQDISRAEWTELEQALKAANVDTTSLPYIRQVRATTKMTQLSTVSSAPQQPAGDNLFGRFSSLGTTLGSRLTDRLKESGMSSNLPNFDSLIGGIKNFLPVNRDLTTTKIVESIMDPSAASSSAIQRTENYLYFDPRNAHARGTMPPPSSIRAGGGSAPGALPGSLGTQGPGTGASFGQRRQGYSEAIVFTVGGGSYDEYTNVAEWAARTSAGDRTRRKVTYGSTEILSANDFVREELERLGREVS